MIKPLRKWRACVLTVALLGLPGCMSTHGSPDAASEKSGAELWAQNCQRCHNTPPPNAYSDDQWDVVLNHMRVRAHLSAREAEQIVKFLKLAN